MCRVLVNKRVSALLISLVFASIFTSIGILGAKEKLLLQEPILFKLTYARTKALEIETWIKENQEKLICFDNSDLERFRKGRILIKYVNVSKNYDNMTIYLRNLGVISYPIGSKFKINVYYLPTNGNKLEEIYVGEFTLSTPFKLKDLKTITIPIDLKPYRGLAIYIIVTSPIGLMDAVAFILSSK